MISLLSFTGCNIVDTSLIKLGLRNNDFEYIKEEKTEKIVIQSSRDPGFRFVVTDSNALNDIYDILSKGKSSDTKTTLDPDYVFEIHVGKNIKYYNYVVNSNESNVGNFYDSEKAYDISKTLDQTIIQNLSFIRKPRNFELIYYNSILEVLKKKKTDFTASPNKVGIDMFGDVDCLKYVFSVDLMQFEKDLDDEVPGTKLVKNNAQDFDTVITVKNKGYSSKVFKTTITVDNKKDKSFETYYVQGDYEFKSWTIKVSDPNKVPDNW